MQISNKKFETGSLLKNKNILPQVNCPSFYLKASIIQIAVLQNLQKSLIMDMTAIYPARICLFKVNNRNTKKRCETCSQSAIKSSSVTLFWCFMVNFEDISHLVLIFILLTLST